MTPRGKSSPNAPPPVPPMTRHRHAPSTRASSLADCDRPCGPSPIGQVEEFASLTTNPALCDPVTVGEADGAFEPYPDLPSPIPVCITQDDVEAVSSRLSGAAGPGGTDAVELSNWLLRFGRESKALREEIVAIYD
jgi:hypothetical protein